MGLCMKKRRSTGVGSDRMIEIVLLYLKLYRLMFG